MAGLTFWEYADLELLHVVDNVANGKGASTLAIAAILEIEARHVGSRLSWMRRNQLLTRDSDGAWYVTPTARKILRNPRQIEAVRKLARGVSSDDALGWMAKREWRRELVR